MTSRHAVAGLTTEGRYRAARSVAGGAIRSGSQAMRGQLCTADGTWNAEVEQVVPGGVAWRAKRHPFDTNPWVLVIPPFWVHRHAYDSVAAGGRNSGMTEAGMSQVRAVGVGGVVDLSDGVRVVEDIDALDYADV